MKLLATLLLAAAPSWANYWGGLLWFGPKAQSRWHDRTITIDGQDDDWDGIAQGEDFALTYAFENDALDLFVLLVPHSGLYREELEGIYEQDFTLWVDPNAGMDKKVGLRIESPDDGNPDEPRKLVLIGKTAEQPAACESADMRLGPVARHGVLEARIPLACFGGTLGQVFTVGFEAGEPKQPPPRKAGEHFDRLYIWVRVKPAAPPKLK